MIAIQFVFATILVYVANTATAKETVDYMVGSTKITGAKIEYHGNELHIFQRIPFAKPPVGDLRFKAPQKLSLSETSSIDGTAEMPLCAQEASGLNPNVSMSEDCLYLMVYVSEKVKKDFDTTGNKVPVVFIIYGGGFTSGGAALPIYDGKSISNEGMVVVAINYRLGVLGFMDHNNDNAPGNMGLMDQQLALKWVHEYIHHFAGDANNVTLMGVSAGSMSVSAHIINDESRKLFKNAVMDGGSVTTHSLTNHFQNATEQNIKLAKHAGCSGVNNLDDAHTCLMQKSSKEILDAQTKLAALGVIPLFLTYGSSFFPEDPKIAVTKIQGNLPKIFIGTAKLEGSIFIDKLSPDIYPPKNMSLDEAQVRISILLRTFRLKPKSSTYPYAKLHQQGVIDVITDGVFACGVLDFADQLSLHGAPVYLYQMDYFTQVNPFGLKPHAHHGVAFLFQLGLQLSVFENTSTLPEKEFSRSMLGVTVAIATKPRSHVPLFGSIPLKLYKPSKRMINMFTEGGSLNFQEGHDRDQMCMTVWGYKIPSE